VWRSGVAIGEGGHSRCVKINPRGGNGWKFDQRSCTRRLKLHIIPRYENRPFIKQHLIRVNELEQVLRSEDVVPLRRGGEGQVVRELGPRLDGGLV